MDAIAAGRSRRVLWSAAVLGGMAQSLSGVAGGLLVVAAGWPDAATGLPMAAQVCGAAVAAPALSRLSARRGRRGALGAGAALGAAGCLLVGLAAGWSDLALVLAGELAVGGGTTAVMLGRYAAADLGPEAARARAMAHVLVATTVGAVVGPNLLAPAGALGRGLGASAPVTAHLLAAVGFAAAAAVLAGGLRGSPRTGGATAPRPVVPPPAVRAWPAVGALATANLVMVGVMTAAPVHLQHGGSGPVLIGAVVAGHIAAMYAPAPLSAFVTDRLGPPGAVALAAAVLVAAGGLAATAPGPAALAAAMVVLGAGWNLALIGGSALLTAGVPAAHRPRREGAGESAMAVAAAVGGAASGPLLVAGGYPLLGGAGAAAAALVVGLVVLSRPRCRAARPR
jgi:MFS family permease